jgi:transposase
MSDQIQATLFSPAELFPATNAAVEICKTHNRSAKPRINKPDRFQAEMHFESLDQRIDADHPVRLVWKFVEGLDLSSLYQEIEAVEGTVGRNASDPCVLFALWLYAAMEGVNSARELDRLCTSRRDFEWLCGKVPVNYHMLADFRVQNGDLVKELQADSLAGMVAEGLITLECVAQDGMRVRASAGSHSFRRKPTLEEARQEACVYLDKVESQEGNDAEQSPRQKKARERAAREKLERVDKALEVVQQLAEQREKRKKGDGIKARASTTDPDARNMKMGDGGFRPAYNVQMATDTQTGIIVGMDVVKEGSDAGQIKPMMSQIKEDLGKVPENVLTDGGFSTLADIEATTQAGTTVYTPVKEEDKQKQAGKDPFVPKPGDSPIIASWRTRMGTLAAKVLYKLRPATAELSNARLRNQGMYQFGVRGLAKVKAVVSWHVMAVNMLRAEALRAANSVSGGIPCAQGQ